MCLLICITSLSIGENAGIVSFEGVVENVATHTIEDVLLRCEMLRRRIDRKEAVVESECFGLFAI